MNSSSEFMNQINELIRDNGWEGQLIVEELNLEGNRKVSIRLAQNHPVAPFDLINEYREDIHSLEQVQQECLRALRTGRPGA